MNKITKQDVFTFVCKDGTITLPIYLFNYNSKTKAFLLANPTNTFETTENKAVITDIINIMRGYQYAKFLTEISCSKLACKLGLTNCVIINIGNKEMIILKNRLTDNFEYFEKLFSHYESLDPDYSEIVIDRSPDIFMYIIEHIYGKVIPQSDLLIYGADMLSDAEYYGYRSKTIPFTYYPTIDMRYFSKNLIIKLGDKMYIDKNIYVHNNKVNDELKLFENYVRKTDNHYTLRGDNVLIYEIVNPNDIYYEKIQLNNNLITAIVIGNFLYIYAKGIQQVDHDIRPILNKYQIKSKTITTRIQQHTIINIYEKLNDYHKIIVDLSTTKQLVLSDNFLGCYTYGFASNVPIISCNISIGDVLPIFNKYSYDFVIDSMYYVLFGPKVTTDMEIYSICSIDYTYDYKITIEFDSDNIKNKTADLYYIGLDKNLFSFL